jgi:hypothetical protein
LLTASQMRAARALLEIDQRQLAGLAGVSLPTIQRMEASAGTVRCVVNTLVKVIDAFEQAGIEIIGADASGGYGVRLRHTDAKTSDRRSGDGRETGSVDF